MGEKTFNLTWNNHLANLSGLFEGLYKSGSLTDTTLACQGGMLRAHKLVLAACSPYFERVFKEHYGEQPILILKGVPVEEMECLLDFMYRGSINVSEEHLPSLIKTATDLEIRGLSGDHRNESSSMYLHIETRLQTSHDTRHRPIDYRKVQPVSFLSKQNCGSPMTASAGIKMEEIEVEDDPMVMESHEDNYDDLTFSKGQIRHVPPPMFKQRQNTRYEGQKRVTVGRPVKENDMPLRRQNDNLSPRNLDNDESLDNGISDKIRLELNYNSSNDPTVPAIQLNEDSSEQRTLQCTETLEDSSRSPKSLELKAEDMKNNLGNITNSTKDRKVVAQRSKPQYKPFPCDLCTLAFTRASHLARHRRVHTGERPFGCNVCARKFARQDKLKQHLDSHYQWPRRKALAGLGDLPPQAAHANRGKRGRPRKVPIETTAMEEILKFGEFSSMLNKTQMTYSATSKADTKIRQNDDGNHLPASQEDGTTTRKNDSQEN